MLELTRPGGLICDLDGTLINTEAPALLAWLEGARATSLSDTLSEEFFRGLTGYSKADVYKRLIEQLKDVQLVDRLCLEALKVYEDRMRQGIDLMPGALDLIEYAESCDIPCAIATSASREAAHLKLSKTPLKGRFTSVVTLDDVSQGKPAPDVFLKAAQELQVPNVNCWVVEDSNPGVEAGLAANMPTWMITEAEAIFLTEEMRKPHIVRSLMEVRDALEALPR